MNPILHPDPRAEMILDAVEGLSVTDAASLLVGSALVCVINAELPQEEGDQVIAMLARNLTEHWTKLTAPRDAR